MKKRNLQPQQIAAVERPELGKSAADPLALFAAGGGGVAPQGFGFVGGLMIPFAGDDAE